MPTPRPGIRNDSADAALEGARRAVFAAAIGAATLQRIAADTELPHPLPGEPLGFAAAEIAGREAPRVVAKVARAAGLHQWDYDAFRDHFVRGVLAMWRPGTVIEEWPRALRVKSTTCPVRERVQQDPRVCETCRLLQIQVAKHALADWSVDVTLDVAAPRGSGACVLTVRMDDA